MTKTPITYYGGKLNMLKEILPLIPEHTIYTEAFFGIIDFNFCQILFLLLFFQQLKFFSDLKKHFRFFDYRTMRAYYTGWR